MKKIVLILSLIMLLGITVVHAHVTKGTDKFTGGQRINSANDISGQIDFISLTKIINPNSNEYEILVNKSTVKEFALTKTIIEFKVDGNPSRKIDVQNLQKTQTLNPYIFSYSIKTSIDQNLIDEIKNAKRIALKFQLAEGSQPVIVLGENILAEWQQVINTEK